VISQLIKIILGLRCLAAFLQFYWHFNKNQFQTRAECAKYWLFNSQGNNALPRQNKSNQIK